MTRVQGQGDVAEQPIQELSSLRDVQPPAALVARVMTKLDRKSTRLNSSHIQKSRMPSSA